MEYEGQICRAPMERSAFMLPVMVGCSYNGCRFCNLFRHLKYRVLPMEQIEGEIRRVQKAGGNPRRIFLGDGNAFDLSAEHLLEILERIEKAFPGREMVNMDATVTGILKKSDEELRLLQRHGVRHLYLGIESGLDDVLAFMHKDHSLAQAYEAIGRLQEAGMVYDAHIMTGIAGKGRGQENAVALAEFLNRTGPVHIVNFSLFLHREVPLYASIQDGSFVPEEETENLREEHTLIKRLNPAPGTVFRYDGFHDFIEFRVRGTLPNDREKMLEKLENAVEIYQNRAPVYSFVGGECPKLIKYEGEERRGNVWQNT